MLNGSNLKPLGRAKLAAPLPTSGQARKLLTELEGHLTHALLCELLGLWEGLFDSCHAGYLGQMSPSSKIPEDLYPHMVRNGSSQTSELLNPCPLLDSGCTLAKNRL